MQAKFCRKFNLNNYSQKGQIYRWVHKVCKHHQQEGRKNPDQTGSWLQDILIIWQLWGLLSEGVRKKSPRIRSQELGLSHESLQIILKKDLQLYPYRILIKHKLTQADMEKCLEMCWWFENKIEANFLDDVWFKDVAHFLLCKRVNSETVCIGAQKPQTRCFRTPALSEMYDLGGYLKTLNNQTVLV